MANALDAKLTSAGHHTYILDGDNVRHGLNSGLGFSAEDRRENVRRIGEVARLMVDLGIIVLVPVIRCDCSRLSGMSSRAPGPQVYRSDWPFQTGIAPTNCKNDVYTLWVLFGGGGKTGGFRLFMPLHSTVSFVQFQSFARPCKIPRSRDTRNPENR